MYRSVPHDARLGSIARVANTVVPLTAVRTCGGVIPRTVLVVMRRHPLLMQHRRGPAHATYPLSVPCSWGTYGGRLP